MAIDLEKLEDAPHLVDILIQVEDVLDSLDIYTFRNWFDGEVISGPRVKRHWVEIGLLYPHDKMPDPRACLRLLKQGIHVEYSKVRRAADRAPTDPANTPPAEGNGVAAQADPDPADHGKGDKAAVEAASDWMVTITVPRRLLTQMDAAAADEYDEDVELEDVEDANNSGMDDESAYMSDEQAPNAPLEAAPPMPDDQQMGAPPNAPPA